MNQAYQTIHSDFTVVGAGYAGLCTAISAARQGMKVTLVNDRDVLGGNVSSEHRVSIGGAASGGSYYARESGIADEIKMTLFHHIDGYVYKDDFHLSDMVFLQFILNEENILYYPGTAVFDCECENGKITKAFGFNANTQKYYAFESPLFCDASGDGILGLKAGAEYRVGREAKSEFQESLAPEEADSHVMGSCILFSYRHEGKPVKFRKPDFAYDLVKDGVIKYFDRAPSERRLPPKGGPYSSIWWIEYGGMSDTVADADAIDFELKKLIYGYWDYIKNSGNYPEAEDCRIQWIAPYASKRESRRFMGEYIMTQNDIQKAREFEDAVSIGGWALDIHDVEGIYGSGQPSAYGDTPSMYNIPLGIMISKDISNLLLAGRLVSCTHVALGSLRVNHTLGAMGQAAGTAAALCKKYNCMPKEVREKHITELQDVLQADGQFIIGRKEDCGFAVATAITAASEKKAENMDAKYEIPLESGVILTLPGGGRAYKEVEVYLKNHSGKDSVCRFSIFGEQRIQNHHLGKLLSEGEQIITGNHDGYVKFMLPDNSDHKIFIRIEANPQLSVLCSDERITGFPSFAENQRPLVIDGETRSVCFHTTAEGLYAPSNVVNGYSRPFGLPNCWVSDGKGKQCMKFAFEKPVSIREIQLYFNAQFETDQLYRPVRQLIKDYDVTVMTSSGETIYSVRDNYIGRNVIPAKAKDVKEVRIDFIENYGAPNFELFAVKIF